MTTPTASPRLPSLELGRALASQLTMWHHLAFYGPLSDYAYPTAPWAVDFLYDYARFSVQLFFVLGGFLISRALARPPADWKSIGQTIWHRYRRIAGPYIAILIIAIGANALSRSMMDHWSISGPPTIPSLLAHLVLLQDVLGFEPLTTGIWYLAVDFQLFLISLLVTALCVRATGADRGRNIAQGIFAAFALSALFYFNRRAEQFDHFGIYFFGSYFLGMALEWTVSRRWPQWMLALYMAVMIVANVVEFRPRHMVAMGTAVVVWLVWRLGKLDSWPRSRASAYLGKISYSLFLIHFPVSLVINGAFHGTLADKPGAAWAAMFLSATLSLLAAAIFYRFVEGPLTQIARKPNPPQAAKEGLGASS